MADNISIKKNASIQFIGRIKEFKGDLKTELTGKSF